MVKPPRKWPPRVFAVYLVTTVIGGVVLILFLILIGLMYWMNARVPLPDAKQLIPPNATAWLIVRADSLNALPVETLSFLTNGAPSQITHLLARAGSEKPCPIQIVLSAFPDADGKGRQMCMAISLGKYPGQFWLVRRDLERRVEKQSLPMSLQYHAHKAIFSAGDSANSLAALSLVGCTVLRCPDVTVAETLIDQMEMPTPSRRATVPQCASFEGWAASWQEISLKLFFGTDSEEPHVLLAVPGGDIWLDRPYSPRQWKSIISSLPSNNSALAQTGQITFSGSFPDRHSADMKVTFHTGSQSAPALVKELNALLTKEKIEIGPTRLTVTGDGIEFEDGIRFKGE